MKKGHGALIHFLYRLLNAGVFSSAVILCFPDFFRMTVVTGRHFVVLLSTIVLFLIVRDLNKRQRIYAILSMALFFAILAGVTGREKLTEWFLAENGFLWTFILAVLVCTLHLLFEKYIFLKIPFAAVMCTVLLYLLFAKQHVSKMGVLLLLLYAVMTLTEYLRIICGKKKRENSHAYLVWMTPFLALYFCILCLMPMPETPYSWQWLKNIYLRAEEKVTLYVENMVNRNTEDLDGAVSGFSDRAAFFSNIGTDNKNIMVIETPQGERQPLYLTGKIYDSFDGRVWKSTGEGNRQERLLDAMETLCALEGYVQSNQEHLACFQIIRAKTGYRHFHTAYLLAPAKAWKIEGKLGYKQSGADFVFDKKAGYGTEYTFTYCQMNMGRRTMQDFLQSEVTENEDLWENTVKKYAEEEIPYANLYVYRESIQNQYLKETVLSPEVEEWLTAVTKDAGNDSEKLFCIEEALADMEYNTNPGGLPKEVTDEQSFLRYFLVENPEGYCSHFATAFVLLARAEGFPARYVQGFCIPVGNAGETQVYASMAHAWPEVYMEGRGWIPFEPTPGYGISRYMEEDEKVDNADGEAKIQETGTKEHGSDDRKSLDDQREEEHAKTERLKREILFLLKCVLLVFVTGIPVFVIDRLGEKYREKGKSSDEKYRRAVLRNLQILSMLGYERQQSETYHELLERIRKSDGGKDIPTAFIETYESVLYGTREAGEKEIAECSGQREELIQILRNVKGRKYLFYRIKLYLLYK